MTTRAFGLFLLALCGFAIWRLHEWTLTAPRHPPSIAEMLLSLAATLAGVSGALCLIVGPALFRPYSWPPHADQDRP